MRLHRLHRFHRLRWYLSGLDARWLDGFHWCPLVSIGVLLAGVTGTHVMPLACAGSHRSDGLSVEVVGAAHHICANCQYLYALLMSSDLRRMNGVVAPVAWVVFLCPCLTKDTRSG